jgi:hypothetical protein
MIGLATVGLSYRVQVWVRLPSGAETAVDFKVTVRLICTEGSAQYVEMVGSTSVSSEYWTEMVGTNELPECDTGTPTSIDLYVEGPATISSFYIDDVVFELD